MGSYGGYIERLTSDSPSTSSTRFKSEYASANQCQASARSIGEGNTTVIQILYINTDPIQYLGICYQHFHLPIAKSHHDFHRTSEISGSLHGRLQAWLIIIA